MFLCLAFPQNTATFVVSRLEQARLQQAKEDAANKLSRCTFALIQHGASSVKKRDKRQSRRKSKYAMEDIDGEAATTSY